MSYHLTLWLGLPGERRAWLEQIEFIPLLLKKLSPHFPKIQLFIDGLTAYDGERLEIAENLALFNKIISTCAAEFFDFEQISLENNCFKLKKGEFDFKFKSLSGRDYRTKICYALLCDLAIIEAGTTLLPAIFASLPAVVFFGVSNHFTDLKHLLKNPLIFPIDKAQIKQRNVKLGNLVFDYHIPPEHVFNLLAELLEKLASQNKLKNKAKFKNEKLYFDKYELKIPRLEMPPTSVYAQKYELKNRFGLEFDNQQAVIFSTFLEKNEILNKKLDEIQNKLKIYEEEFLILEKFKQNQVQNSALLRVRNHLPYKLGQILIKNSHSFKACLNLPFLLIRETKKHKKELKIKEILEKSNPNLKALPLEKCADYEAALKEKSCFTYKLGQELIHARKTWYKFGFIRFYFIARRLEKEFKARKK